MNDPEIMQMFVDAGAIITGSHFVYNSGRHSSVYINKDALYLHTGIISQLCQRMALPYTPDEIDVVVGPVLGGIVLSQWTTYALNAKRTTGETLAVYAEKEAGSDHAFAFYRSYDRHIPGKNILVVEDILTTGGSVRRVIELISRHGGNVVGVSALCNRGNVQPKDVGDVPINTLVTLDLETYAEENCPFCEQRVPINTEVGKGRMFLAKQKAV
jgi:orotate phosphoribosyltransferase